jgi:polar amino acid transport system substrate-binding protein
VFQRPRLVAATSVLTIGILALAGCSSSKKSSTGAGAGTSSTSSSSVNAAAAALVPAAIKSKGTLTVAMDATYPPDESVAADGKTIEGMDVDLINALAATLGLKTKLVNVKFDSIIPRIQSGTYDVGMSSFTDTKDREKTVDFVTYFQAGEGFYTKAGASKTYDGLDSLCGAKVAVESGTTELSDAQSMEKKCPTENKPKPTVLAYDDQNSANLAVSSGRADLGFVDSQVAGYIVKQSNGQFQLTGTAFEVAPYGIALPKGTALTQAFLAAVKAVMANGTYQTVLAKWGLQAGAITTPVINGAQS